MKPLNILLKVSAGALLSHPTFPASAWNNFSRKAYVEPIVVRDGFHDFVLMGAPDYAEMQKLAAWATAEQAKRKEPPIGSPDIGIVAAALGQMAKIGTPARPVYQMKCPACSGRGYDTSGSGPVACVRCQGRTTIDTDCRCNAAGKIICQPATRC